MSRLTLLVAAALLLAAPCRPDSQGPADQSTPDLNALTLEQLMEVKVQGAALHPQTLQEAPASVTIITAEDIRKYGYRTLGEALAAVRGFYVTNDRTYTSVGVRGFDVPGDYDSELLVMVNGHNMTEHIFDFVLFFGNDFPIDMNLIKQIEIIRGPSSALYGSNAMFATINIVTKSQDEAGPLSLTADTGSFGEKKVQIVETASLGGAKVLLSGSVYNNAGQSPLFFPQFTTPQNNYGNAIDMNGEKGYHFFANLAWRNWTVVAAFADHDIIQPVSWGNTIFNDRGTNVNDQRDFVDARSAAARCCGAPITTHIIAKAATTMHSAKEALTITARASSAIGWGHNSRTVSELLRRETSRWWRRAAWTCETAWRTPTCLLCLFSM
jgi:outer membrane receptor for ferrienterochelin and colicins